jgi:hypothetical protein
MAWVRIHDGAMDNLKIMRLSDSAFRLWVRGLSYCQTQLTDGRVPTEALQFMNARPKDLQLLTSVLVEGKSPLWETVPGFGYQVHDYLDWNDSREVVEEKRDRARVRAKNSRTSRSPHSARAAHATAHVASGVVSREGSTDESEADPEGEPERKPSSAPAIVAPRAPGRVRHDRDFGRIFLHAWQQQALVASLGPHAEAFDLDLWLDSLTALADAKGVTFPNKDIRWAWVQAQLTEEVQRRGLPIASGETKPSNARIDGLRRGGEAFLRRVEGAQA